MRLFATEGHTRIAVLRWCMQTNATGIRHQANGNADCRTCLSDLAKLCDGHQGCRCETHKNVAGLTSTHRPVVLSCTKNSPCSHSWFQLWSSNIVGATFFAWKDVVRQQLHEQCGLDAVFPRLARSRIDFTVPATLREPQPLAEAVRVRSTRVSSWRACSKAMRET